LSKENELIASSVVVQFGGARVLTSRLARTLASPKVAKCTTTALSRRLISDVSNDIYSTL